MSQSDTIDHRGYQPKGVILGYRPGEGSPGSCPERAYRLSRLVRRPYNVSPRTRRGELSMATTVTLEIFTDYV